MRFRGLRLEADATIALGLDGDIEPLAELARFVPEAAESVRLYVDRRKFRPQLTFATAAPDAPMTLLKPALEALEGWSGVPWPVQGLSLLRTRWVGGESTPEEYDLIELSASSAALEE